MSHYPSVKNAIGSTLISQELVTWIIHAGYKTVDEKSNNRLYLLLKAYKAKSGNSLLINTSFNVKDQPIVCSHKEAYDCFLNTDMDALVMEDSLILKPSEA